MTALILGLVLFLGMHSTRIFADGWRSRVIAQRGENAWKGLYSALSLAGIVLLCWGYGQARLTPTALWASPVWTRHLAATLMWPALVLMAAAYVPRNGLKARLHHPMVLSVKVWAIAHLLANNTAADVLLFGGFLVWAVLDFRSARRRDKAKGTVYPAGTAAGTAAAVGVGSVLWAALVFGGHFWLFGVRPFGG